MVLVFATCGLVSLGLKDITFHHGREDRAGEFPKHLRKPVLRCFLNFPCKPSLEAGIMGRLGHVKKSKFVTSLMLPF